MLLLILRRRRRRRWWRRQQAGQPRGPGPVLHKRTTRVLAVFAVVLLPSPRKMAHSLSCGYLLHARHEGHGRCVSSTYARFSLQRFCRFAEPPCLGAASSVCIRPSKLTLPREVSLPRDVKAKAFIPARSPSDWAELGNVFFTGTAASKTSPRMSLMSRLTAKMMYSRTSCCLGRSVW